MLIVIITSTFACVALLVMSLYLYAFRRTSVLDNRLEEIDPAGGVLDENPLVAIAERIALPINRILPVSASEAQKIQKQLFYAGYASPDAPLIYRAIQIISMVSLPCIVLVVCFLLDRPVGNFLIWGFIAAALGFYLPRYLLTKRIKNRQQRITWGLADALDLLVIAVEAGLGLNAALIKVGEELRDVHPEIHQEFEMVNLEIRVGRARDEALRNLSERTGVDDIRSFVALMIQADRFGSSIGKAVRVFADALRTKRRQRAEQASQKATLKLLFPLTCFLFPVVIIIILGPTALILIDLFFK